MVRNTRARRWSNCVCAAPALIAAVAGAQTNGQFEDATNDGLPAAWLIDGADVALDVTVARNGASLRIDQADAENPSRVTQEISPAGLTGNRIRLTGHIKTDDLRGGSASLWIRLDGPDGLLYVDRMRDRGARGTSDWTRYEVQAPAFPEATRISFGALVSGRGTAWIDDLTLESADTAGLPSPSAAARRYVLHALEIMREHSVMRAAVAWPALEQAALEQARGAVTVADAHLAVSYALRRLGDRHSFLSSPAQSRSLRETPVSNARTGRRPIEPRIATLERGVGYLWLPGFAGGQPSHQVAFGNRVQELIGQLDQAGSCGFIVDLRDNRGGNLWPMLIGLGPLLGDGAIGAAHFPDGTAKPLAYVRGQARYGEYTQLRVSAEPVRLRRAEAPVAVLIGSDTASSAEVLAAGFHGRHNARSFGEPTSGVSTGTRTFELSDGAALVLAVAATSDRTGRVWDGSIAPDQPVPRGARGTPLEEQPAVTAAVNWLLEQPSCASAAG